MLAGASLVLAGCSTPGPKVQAGVDQSADPSPTATGTDEDVAADLVEFYEQDVAWEDCSAGFECADVTVR